MRYDYRTEHFQKVKVKGTECLFNDMRIDRGTVPDGKYLYEVADGDSDGIPARIREGIMVNFYGTIITDHPLPMEDGVMWLDEEDWKWVD